MDTSSWSVIRPVMPTKKPSKKKLEVTEKFMEKIPDMVNQNVQDALEKFQDTKDNMTTFKNQ
jgi:hypothetical protein